MPPSQSQFVPFSGASLTETTLLVPGVSYSIFNHLRSLIQGISRESINHVSAETADLIELYGDDARFYSLWGIIEVCQANDPSQRSALIEFTQAILPSFYNRPVFAASFAKAFQQSINQTNSSTQSLAQLLAIITQILQLPASWSLVISLHLSLSPINSVRELSVQAFIHAYQTITRQTFTRTDRQSIDSISDVLNEQTLAVLLNTILGAFATPTSPFTGPNVRSLIFALRLVDPALCSSGRVASLINSLSNAASAVSQESEQDEQDELKKIKENEHIDRKDIPVQAEFDPKDALFNSSDHRLSSVLRHLGPQSMSSVQSLTAVFRMVPSVNDADVAACLIVMARTHARQGSGTAPALSTILNQPIPLISVSAQGDDCWSPSVFVDSLRSLKSDIRWTKVFSLLDHPSFLLPSHASYLLLLDVWKLATNNDSFPMKIFLTHEWKNERGRLTFLKWACPINVELFSMHDLPKQVGFAPDEADSDSLPPADSPLAVSKGLYNGSGAYHGWWNLDVMQALSDIGHTSASKQLQSLCAQARERVSQLRNIGLITESDTIILPVCLSVFPTSFTHSLIAPLLQNHRQTVFSCLTSLLLHHPIFIDCLITAAQSLNRTLRTMISSSNDNYARELLWLCVRRCEERMLRSMSLKAEEFGPEFVDSCVNHISSLSTPGTLLLSVPHVATLFRLCYARHSMLSLEMQSTVDHNFAALIDTMPLLTGYVNVDDDVEYAADAVLAGYFKQTVTLNAMLAQLNELKGSSSPKDREVFAACIAAMYREYRHLASYPRILLQLHALLFGSLVNEHFVTSFLRGLALKFVLDAANSESDKLRHWASLALTQFRTRLLEWPAYCSLLSSSSHLQQSEPAFVAALQSVGGSSKTNMDDIAMNVFHEIVPAMETGWHGLKTGMPALDTIESAAMLTTGSDLDFGGREDHSWLLSDILDNDDSLSTGSSSTAAARAHPAVPANSFGGISQLANGSPLSHFTSFGAFGAEPARNSHPLLPLNTPPPGLIDTSSSSHSVIGSSLMNRPIDSSAGPSLAEPHSPPATSSSPPPGLFHPRQSALPSQPPSTPNHNTSSDGHLAASNNVTPGRSGAASGFAATHNIDSLLTASHGPALAPVESIKDKIHFIINNASAGNIRSKARELRMVLRPEYFIWFSRWFTIHRVSTEQNFQRTYLQLIDSLESTALVGAMIEAAYENIHVLLASEKVLTSSAERSLLKNLGSWLGLLTIAKNTPVRAKQLDLKQLILTGHDLGRLIAVIPFCAKVLEACSESKVFKPPNPWLMALAGLLKEIFDLPGLKLNLKFEIEVLFRTLDISMKDVKATALLRERGSTSDFRPGQQQASNQQAQQRLATTNGQSALGANLAANRAGLPSRRPASPHSSLDETDDTLNNDALPGVPRAATPGALAHIQINAQDANSLIPNLHQFVVISPSLPFFSMFPQLKRCVPSAISTAIREIIQPVVERSVTIACVTTRELILKDFAMEPDENKMRMAAHSMVQNLTASLALVTCKEPLRVSINNNLGTLLEANTASLPNATDPAVKGAIEQACLQVSNDNLDLCCSLIEKSAAERAVREIDESLAPAYMARRKARESGQTYADTTVFASARFPAGLPDQLRVKPPGLNPTQLRIYDDFSRMRQHYAALVSQPPVSKNRSASGDATAPAGSASMPTPARPVENVQIGYHTEMPPNMLPQQQQQQQSMASWEAEIMAKEAAKRRMAGQSPTPPASGARTGPGPVQQMQPVGGVTAGNSPPLTAHQQSFSAAAQIPAMLPPSQLTSQQILDKLVACLAALEAAVLRLPNHKSMPLSLSNNNNANPAVQGIREDHEIMQSLKLIQSLLQLTPRDQTQHPDSRDQIALTFAHKVFKRLYDRENRTSLLQIDVHTQVLKYIRQVCPKLVMELTAWLLLGDDDRKFIIPITVSLIRHRLVNTAEFDTYLTKTLVALQNSGKALATVPNPALAQPQAPGSAPLPPTVQVLHASLEYAMSMVRRLIVKRSILPAMELKSTLEALNSLAHASRHKLLQETIGHLLDDVRAAAIQAERENDRQQPLAAPATGLHGVAIDPLKLMLEAAVHGVPPSLGQSVHFGAIDEDIEAFDATFMDDSNEATGYRQLVFTVLEEWMQICLQNSHSDKTYSHYLSMLNQNRLLATPELTSKFFRTLLTFCVDASLNSLNESAALVQSGAQPPTTVQHYAAIDALIKLFIFLVKFLDTPPLAPSPSSLTATTNANKIKLLASFLNAVHAVLKRDYLQHRTTFNQRPYLRLLNNLLHDLNNPDPTFDSNNSEVLYHFASIFYFLNPNKIPPFIFGWLELISHRMFMSKLLIHKNNPNSSLLFARLFMELLKFQQPFLRQAELTESIKLIYKGTLRILLVLLHDFPEFLCEYHFHFCDVIPPTCIQMRNLILSAFPRSMRLPDPFTPNLKVDLLPEIAQQPRLSADVTLALGLYRNEILRPLEQYLKTNDNRDAFLESLPSMLTISGISHMFPQVTETDVANTVRRAGTQYNVPLINALVLYIGINAISQSKTVMTELDDSPALVLFSHLMLTFDSEGRYHTINALANQLRYPNAHTHYFSMVLLNLFLRAPNEVIREQITRVLIERLIVHRPHPWGLLITFMELMKNPRYQFWDQAFTSAHPEMERLFESVARSCMTQRQSGTANGQSKTETEANDQIIQPAIENKQ